MKKIALFAMAALVAVVSCRKEGMNDANTANVSFAIEVPSAIGTKAIGDGTTVDELLYAVYDASGKHITSLDGVVPVAVEIDGKRGWTLNLTLVKNYTYRIFFWAQKKDAGFYTLDKDAAKVTVSYEGAANDESRDAFCYLATIAVPSDVSTFVPNDGKPFELRRPFAQINFGASDYKMITELGLTMTSTVSMKGLYDTYSFLTGEVSGEAATDLTLSQIPAEKGEKLTVNNDADTYGYVGMNYILAPENQVDEEGNVVKDVRNVSDVTATFAYNDAEVSLLIPSVPYQRNFRTNIVGNFFSGDVKVDVIVVEDFIEPDIIVNYPTNNN